MLKKLMDQRILLMTRMVGTITSNFMSLSKKLQDAIMDADSKMFDLPRYEKLGSLIRL